MGAEERTRAQGEETRTRETGGAAALPETGAVDGALELAEADGPRGEDGMVRPGVYYGARIEGPLKRVAPVGDDRPSGSPRRRESTMNIPGARQIPVEGAVTGPDAPLPEVDLVRGQMPIDELDDLSTS